MQDKDSENNGKWHAIENMVTGCGCIILLIVIFGAPLIVELVKIIMKK